MISYAICIVLNPMTKLEWFKKHYKEDVVIDVKNQLLQAVSTFKLSSHLELKTLSS